MSDPAKEPSNTEILGALQGMWRQQGDLIKGIESRLAVQLEQAMGGAESRLGDRFDKAEERVATRIAQEIQDRPVVVHVDMSRVSDLEKRLELLVARVTELETRLGNRP